MVLTFHVNTIKESHWHHKGELVSVRFRFSMSLVKGQVLIYWEFWLWAFGLFCFLSFPHSLNTVPVENKVRIAKKS